MHKLISSGLWKEVRELANKSKARHAVIAYITTDILNFRKGDILICDASEDSIKSNRTSASVLKKAFSNNVELYSCSNLHAKVMLFDRIAVIGSANCSQFSMNNLIEASVITDMPNVTAQVRSFIEKLKSHSEKIDKDYLKKIESITVVRNDRKIEGKKILIDVPSSKTWLIGVYELDESRFKKESRLIKKGIEKAKKKLSEPSNEISWIRFTGNSKFRKEAKEGDVVIQIYSNKEDKEPQLVFKHSPVVLRDEEPNCTRFYIEDYHDCYETALKWKHFLKLTTKLGLPFKVSPKMVRLLPEKYTEALRSLWD